MRYVGISVHNTQTLECFCEPRREGFEVWIVGKNNGERQVLSHYLTHTDLEKFAAYAEGRPLRWQDAESALLPPRKHQVAQEEEQTIARRKFWDLSKAGYYIIPKLVLLAKDRKDWNQAKKELLGTWSDGEVQFTLENESKAYFESLPPPGHILRVVSGVKQDSWRAEGWQLFTFQECRLEGVRNPIVNVQNKEMHLPSNDPRYLAHIFHKVE